MSPIARPAADDDRRTRPRLRELCDEVIASYRAAQGRDPIADGERREAEAFLANLTPRRSA
jgi:hypothetical protein